GVLDHKFEKDAILPCAFPKMVLTKNNGYDIRTWLTKQADCSIGNQTTLKARSFSKEKALLITHKIRRTI
ncbi:hypothetical protein, partial [Glaesserella parasuis]|uniref:hypothetical protein n=1 Tax=Glaesserella parasuis TaxID=738 RepID=UPI002436C91A